MRRACKFVLLIFFSWIALIAEPFLPGTQARGLAGVPSSVVTAQTGLATWVTPRRDGVESASGEIFEGRKMVAAHRTLPWGSIVRVVNLENGRAVTVRVIDRGPYGKNHREGAIVDLSRSAARRLRMIKDGKVRVQLIVLRIGSGTRASKNALH
jgi:rare lipoprotein A